MCYAVGKTLVASAGPDWRSAFPLLDAGEARGDEGVREEGGGAEDIGARWVGWPEVVGKGAGRGWGDSWGGEAEVVVF